MTVDGAQGKPFDRAGARPSTALRAGVVSLPNRCALASPRALGDSIRNGRGGGEAGKWLPGGSQLHTIRLRFARKSANSRTIVCLSPGIDSAVQPAVARSVFIDQAAEMLGVSRRTVYYRIRDGRLRTVRTFGTRRVLVDSIEELLREERQRRRSSGHPRSADDRTGDFDAPPADSDDPAIGRGAGV
jgi:excisionase family DNA binding protein